MPAKSKTPPVRSEDLPATQGMLKLFRKESTFETRSLRSEMNAGFKQVDAHFNQIDGRFKEMDARFNQIDARFNQIDARFDQVDARFKEVDARFDKVDVRLNQMDAKIDKVLAEVARLGTMMEEQRAENRVALEALSGLFQRQERLETRVEKAEKRIDSWPGRT